MRRARFMLGFNGLTGREMGRACNDILNAVVALETTYGDAAEAFAKMQADAAALSGDPRKALHWAGIAAELRTLHMINQRCDFASVQGKTQVRRSHVPDLAERYSD